jgi:hypothetical protein
MSLKSITAKFLDVVTGSGSTRYVINQKIGEYGKIVDLNIDKVQKKIDVVVQLKGEIMSIDIAIEKYSIEGGQSPKIFINKAHSNKPWVNAILRNHIVGKRFDLPGEHSDILDEFL